MIRFAQIHDDTGAFCQMVRQRLFDHQPERFRFDTGGDLRKISSVLLLMGQDRTSGELFFMLNKRSRYVPQPGDLCCPGGGISPILDCGLTHFLLFPFTPLTCWPQMNWWRRNRRTDFPKLSLLLAAALREGFEEMRLNPFGLTFLGPMPPKELVLFKRAVYPMVCWINRQHRFLLNWEVERLVRIPVRNFFDDTRYARYHISYKTSVSEKKPMPGQDMPCFVHQEKDRQELLWGVTYRIVVHFLKIVFNYTPPPLGTLPVIHHRIGDFYLHGAGRQNRNSKEQDKPSYQGT
ncbi:hypothetical protein LJC71_05985 [Desulfosarcina sp. OttesenSCG-928-A07]|nr:hypothetical protein [Desulfosarcina sp. OttesenSCG-928-A07]